MRDDENIDDAKHCIGMYGKHKPYNRHGRAFYRPWRNRFNTNVNDPIWQKLAQDGYAEHGKIYEHEDKKLVTTFYWLTRKGLDWLGEILNVTIYDEEEIA